VPRGASHGIGDVLGAVFDAQRQTLIANAMSHPGKDAADVLDAFIRGLGMPAESAHECGPGGPRSVEEGFPHFPLVRQRRRRGVHPLGETEK
jgi:hypothetical protein